MANSLGLSDLFKELDQLNDNVKLYKDNFNTVAVDHPLLTEEVTFLANAV